MTDDDLAKSSDHRPLIVQDRPAIAKAVGDANPITAQPMAWANATSGSTGVIYKTMTSQQSADCRDFATSYQSVSGTEQVSGTACKDQQSRWNVINLKTQPPS